MDVFCEIEPVMRKILFLIWFAVILLSGCQAEEPEKYIPKSPRKKEKLATPEPGTYLKPAAYSIVKKMNQVIEEPEEFKGPPTWIRKMFTTHQKKVLDTLLQFIDTEVPVRIYYPTRESLDGKHPVTLFFHGGGFSMGSVHDYHPLVSKLAKVTGNIFVSVEYRLAPDHPFPSGLNDCYACLRWLQQHGASIGADTTRISVMGDSAGGNLATVLTLMCRDRNQPQPICQVLLYPSVTFRDTLLPSRIYFCQNTEMNYILSESFMRDAKTQYMGGETNDRHPYLSPLEAQLTPDLAPALVITAEVDPIRDGGRLYAQKLKASGTEVEYREYSGMFHGFMSFHMILGDGLDAMKAIRRYCESK